MMAVNVGKYLAAECSDWLSSIPIQAIWRLCKILTCRQWQHVRSDRSPHQKYQTY